MDMKELRDLEEKIQFSGMQDRDLFCMRAAINLAKIGLNRTSPNPMVGAILVKKKEIVGYGRHLVAGGPHAERYAIDMAGENAEGATLYVTLEPCSHYGRTTPCVDAIIAADIKRVVVAMVDPNPLVAGQGIDKLKSAGIEVDVGLLEKEAIYLNDIYLKNIEKKKTFCSLKTAITLDGKTATVSGSSQWITGEKSREKVHRLRCKHCAVLTSVSTVIADNCRLNCRLDDASVRQPVRIVLDPHLEIPTDAKILNAEDAPTMIITQKSALTNAKSAILTAKGAKIYTFNHENNHVVLSAFFDFLYQMGIMSVMVEAGSRLNKAFLESGLVDKFYVFVAPKFVGGNAAPGIFAGDGVANMANALDLNFMSHEFCETDLFLTAYPK